MNTDMEERQVMSKVTNEDCMELMSRYPDKYFELAIVDPPYGIGVNSMNMGGRMTVKPDSRSWDDDTPSIEYFNELRRVSSNQIIWGGNYFPLPPSRCFLIWDKGEAMYGRDFAECEQAWTSFDKVARIYKKHAVQPDRIHPTQKPVKLYEWILKNYASEGDKILDTHLGSGSSRIAADKMGFDFYACELDRDYFEAQEKRFKEYKSQLILF
jgi:site-specific DNA-methyltransferase (adenine-specific)